MISYDAFLATKKVADPATGLARVPELHEALFPFQRDVVSWALRRGRAALFAGTGLGKTICELSYGMEVARYTEASVLHLAPPAVAVNQILPEAKKWGIPVRLVATQTDCGPGINVTNFQKLHHFNLGRFAGLVLDESSILKSTDGTYRNALIEGAARVPFRLAATATPAPNDFMELGNHAEFLGVMRYTDMLASFFTHDNGDTQKWRLKGHAETAFWSWMASWAVMLRKPSDLGYEDGGFDLPPLLYRHHIVAPDYAPSLEMGLLFPMQARTLQERLAARRDTIAERVAMASSIAASEDASERLIVWCNLNAEQDALERAFASRCLSIRGSNSDDENERRLTAWLAGERPVLIGKPSMIGFGLNLQSCANMIFVGLNDSFEQVFQAVRRCWRFGQTRPVNAHFISADTEGAVVANIRRKEADADKMAAAMVRHMAELSKREVRGLTRSAPEYSPAQPMRLPSWIGEAA